MGYPEKHVTGILEKEELQAGSTENQFIETAEISPKLGIGVSGHKKHLEPQTHMTSEVHHHNTFKLLKVGDNERIFQPARKYCPVTLKETYRRITAGFLRRNSKCQKGME